MSDAANGTGGGPAAAPATAGGLLRQARQAQGLHIAALAAAIKVTQRKLEALEGDRFNELPDATFTRALAQTVCRTLKIDAAPVLALLPPPPGHRLEHVGEGINAPFRERPGRAQTGDYGSRLASPALWAPLLLIVAAAVVYFLPAGWLSLPRVASTPAPAASSVVTAVAPVATPSAPMAVAPAASALVAAVTPAPAASIVVETVHSVPATATEAANADPAPLTGVLQVRTVGESWIEVLDARGQTLLSRVVQPGEAVGLDGVMPLRVTIGNATATQLSFRGKALDLAPHTRRDNVARLDLK